MSADLEEVLDHLTALVEEARSVPMSSSCVVNRGEVLDLVDEARRVLPVQLDDARRTLAEREALLEQAREQADRTLEQGREERDRLVAEGQSEQDRLVEETAVFARAQDDADRLLGDARAEADRLLDAAHAEAERLLDAAHAESEAMRAQTEDYVDGKLAGFEQLLSTTLTTVQRGRDRLAGRADADLREHELDGPPPRVGARRP